ncbi:MAG: glycosyltransferase [Gemmatimonadetes bacterium]|nr:glycosyltransferase [Gemmatimonadota bacterium]
MRRVLVVIDSLGYGGAERLLLTTLAHLDRSRFVPVVVALFGPNPLAGPIRDLDIEVVELGLDGPRDLYRAVVEVGRLLRAHGADLVHTHLFASNVAGRLATRGSRPVVTTLHNPDYGREGPGFLGLRRLLDGGSAHLWAPTFLAVSDDVRRDYGSQLGITNIRLHPNFLDVADLRRRLESASRPAERAALGIGPRDFLLLHVGRFHRQKGQDVLLKALAVLAPVAPRLKAVLVGDGPDQPAARTLAHSLGVADRVRFLGTTSEPERLYRAADAFVFPSRYEAFGMALLEAMAAGLPSAVSEVGGITELTTPDTSLRVPPEEPLLLAEAIARLRTDGNLRLRLGEAARSRATRFDAYAAVRALESVYAEA